MTSGCRRPGAPSPRVTPQRSTPPPDDVHGDTIRRRSHDGAAYRCTIVSLPPFQHLVDEHWRDVARLAHALAPGSRRRRRPAGVDPGAGGLPAAHPRAEPPLVAPHDHPPLRDGPPPRGPPHDTARGPSRWREAPVLRPPEVPDGDLWARVGALPERQRDAVVLRFVGDLDHRAVAAALGTSPGMSRRLVSDAIATLRLDLRDQP